MNAKEFTYMVEAGMPPMFVIQAATTHAAQLLKHEKDFGSVTAGKYADVIAVAGNPLDDVAQLQKVSFVMKAGKVYKRDGAPLPLVSEASEPAPGYALPAE
jgi:imidazolonepropionase-like amidohydrolase